MRPHRALLLTLGAGLFVAACGSDDAAPREVRAAESPVGEPAPPPEGMEDWAYLLGHTTPFESKTDWDGDVDGFKTEWHPNGTKSGEGEYRDTKRVGPWTFWHPNGQKRWEGRYRAGVPAGFERAWYDDGTPHYEGSYANGLRDGAFTYWYPSGRLWWKGSYRKGKRDGVFVQWKADGAIDRVESGIYENGVKKAELELDADGRPVVGSGRRGGSGGGAPR